MTYEEYVAYVQHLVDQLDTDRAYHCNEDSTVDALTTL